MTGFEEVTSAAAATPASLLRLAASAYLARYKGTSRIHTESDLRIYLGWCTDRQIDALSAQRVQVELYVRWLQEVRRFRPSTVSRRLSVVAGFYRTCVIDGVLEHSPADHVRRPNVPPESPTLGLSHLQFEALLTAARESANVYDFAMVAMLGLLGLRIFEATGTNVADLGEEHGHRVLRVFGKGSRVTLVPLPPAVGRAVDRAASDRASGPILLNTRGARMDRHAATRRLHRLSEVAVVQMPKLHSHMLRHAHASWLPVWMPVLTCAMSRSPPGTPTRARPCAMTGLAITSTATPTTSSLPTWPPAPEPNPEPPTAGANC